MIMRRIDVKTLFVAVLAMLAGCMKDEIEYNDVSYRRPLNVAVPVSTISADYNSILRRLAKNDGKSVPDIKSKDDGMLYVEYNKDYHIGWTDVLSMNNIQLGLSSPMPITQGEKINRTVTNRIKLNSDDGQRIDSLIIAKATMTVKAEPMDVDGQYTLNIAELSNGGRPLAISWAAQSGCNQEIDLAGYTIVPGHSTDSSYLTISISMNGTAKSTSISSAFTFSLSATDIEPQIVFGFFGTRLVYNSPSEMPLDFFDSYEFNDGIEFTGTDLTLDVNNWTGTQFDVTMDIMRLVDRDNLTSNIKFNIENTLYVDQVSHDAYRPDGNFKPCANKFTLDTANSDVNSLLSIDPISYKYSILVTSNPKGETKENYLTPESSLDCHVNMYIPLWMKITDMDRTDTIDFDLNSIIIDKDNADYVDTLSMFFDFNNGFPLTMLTQAYLVDGQMRVIDSLFPRFEQVWKMPKIDANKRVSEWAHVSKKAVMDQEKIKRCSDADVKKILLKSIIDTKNAGDYQFFKFYNEYAMTIKFSFEVVSNYLSD